MTDPLAHLYAEGLETDRDEVARSAMDHLAHLYADEDDLELPVVETSLEELVAIAPEPEELTDSDLDELALLVKGHLERGGLPDEEAAALGLGEIHVVRRDYEVDRELVLNDVGRAVLKRLADQEAAR